MKYIRTKDNIYELENTYEHLGKTYYGIKECTSTFSEDEINPADTIEELCDEIVEIIDGKAQVVYVDISFNDLAIAKIRGKNNVTVYGAIWTDKGLIYVAKMNEKGELELL